MNFLKTTKRLLFCITILNLTGCAAIFLPKNQHVTIHTPHPDAKVFISNEEVGEGRTVVAKVKKDFAKQVVIQAPGYKDGYHVLVPFKRHPAYWPLLALDVPFVYPLLFDAVENPKFFRFPQDNNLSASFKYRMKADNEKFLHLEAIKLEVDNKDKDLKDYFGIAYSALVMEEINKAEKKDLKAQEKQEAKNLKKAKKKKNTLDDKKLNYDDTKFSEVVFKTLKKTGYIDTVNKVLADNNNTLVLEGAIKKARVFYVNGKGFSTYKKAKVNVTWSIKNSYGEVLDTISGWSYSGDFAYSLYDKDDYDPSEKMFADAVDNAYLALSQHARFTKLMQVETSFNIDDPALVIRKPKKRVQDVSQASTATVTIKQDDGSHGSGFAITNDGYLLTNFHVIAGKTLNKVPKVTVILSTGEELTATVVRYNRMRDIALLKVNKEFESAFQLGNGKSFRNLMEVYSIGTPKSIELGQSVSLGIISNERKANNNNLLQVSINVNPGNSGGPLFDKGGDLQGVVTSKLVGYATEGVGFAIPSYLISTYLNLSLN
jgi:serine protease Do